MASRSSSTSTLLIVCIVIFTFPIWIGLFGALFGIAAGLIGGTVGIIAGFFGLLIGLVLLPFKILFGCWDDGDWGFHMFPHHGFLTFAIIILIAALIVRKGRKN